MSVSNGKISYRMGKKLGVNADGDLQVVFRSSQMNQSWYFLTAGINIWAKFKPFRHPNGTIYSDHYKGSNGETLTPTPARLAGARQVNYGLVAPTGSVSNIPADVVGKFWAYNRCQSGTDPMQAEDFEGYNHNGAAPVMPMTPDNIDPVLGSQINYYPAIDQGGVDFSPIQRGTRDDMIAIADFADLDGWYVCLLLCNNQSFSSSNSWKWKTASSPIQLNTSGSFASMVPCPVLSHGEVSNLGNYKYYYLCAADTKYDDWSQNPPVTMFKPLPADKANDLKGVFYVQTGWVVDITILQASFVSNPSSSSYADMSNYTGTGSSYYNVNNNYNVALKVRVKAPLQTSVTLTASSMRIALSATFNGGSPHNLGVTMKNSSYSNITSISIAANATADFYLICSTANALAITPSGSAAAVTDEGQQIKVYFTFSHNGYPFTMNHYIRLSN